MSDATITDTDAHYFEPTDDLLNYIDDRNPWVTKLSSKTGSAVSWFPSRSGDGFLQGRINRDEISFPQEKAKPEHIPVMMEQLGVDNIVLLSQLMLSFGRIRGDDERMEIISNAYIDYMLDGIVDPKAGIYTLIPAPFNSPHEAAELIDRVGDEAGVAGVALVTTGPEPPLGNRRYDVIYEACIDHDLPAVFHGGGAGLNEYHKKGYEKFIETHVLGFLENNMAQCVSVVIQGVPVRYPDLTIVFQESGVYWVPLMMQRLDTEYLKRSSEVPILDRLPSEYMKEFFYGTQPLEDPRDPEHLRQIIDQLGGPERLIYASDYPHWDFDPPSTITDKPIFTDDEKARILGGNAKEVFGI